MLNINETNFELFENIIADIVDWFDNHEWVNWDLGKTESGHLTETNAIDCYRALNNNPGISVDDFVELFINIDKYAEIVNDLSISAAFKPISHDTQRN